MNASEFLVAAWAGCLHYINNQKFNDNVFFMLFKYFFCSRLYLFDLKCSKNINIANYYNSKELLYCNLFLWWFIPLHQSSVSHDPSEIILIYWFDAQATFLIFIHAENICAVSYFVETNTTIQKFGVSRIFFFFKKKKESRMISERSCRVTLNTMSKDAETSVLHHMNNLHVKILQLNWIVIIFHNITVLMYF